MPLPPDPDKRNDERAKWAHAALEAFQKLTGSDEEDAVSDLLTDLQHYCDRNGIDFQLALDHANYIYTQETAKTPDLPIQ